MTSAFFSVSMNALLFFSKSTLHLFPHAYFRADRVPNILYFLGHITKNQPEFQNFLNGKKMILIPYKSSPLHLERHNVFLQRNININ